MGRKSAEGSIFPDLEMEQTSTAHQSRHTARKSGENQTSNSAENKSKPEEKGDNES